MLTHPIIIAIMRRWKPVWRRSTSIVQSEISTSRTIRGERGTRSGGKSGQAANLPPAITVKTQHTASPSRIYYPTERPLSGKVYGRFGSAAARHSQKLNGRCQSVAALLRQGPVTIRLRSPAAASNFPDSGRWRARVFSPEGALAGSLAIYRNAAIAVIG